MPAHAIPGNRCIRNVRGNGSGSVNVLLEGERERPGGIVAEAVEAGAAASGGAAADLSPFSGEFRDPDLEEAFLEDTWASTRAHVARAALVGGFAFIVVGLFDLARHGFDTLVLQIALVRLAVFGCALMTAMLALRPVPSPWVGPAMTALFWFMLAAMITVAEIRDLVGMTYVAALMAVVIAHYMFAPVRTTVAMVSALLLSAVGVAYAAHRGTAPVIDVDGLAAVLIAANLLGGTMVHTLNRARRRDYAGLRAEQALTRRLRSVTSALEGELRIASAERDRLGREAIALAALREALPEGLLVVDGRGQVSSWNGAFARIWGLDGVPLAGVPAAQLRRRLKARLDTASPAELLAPIDTGAATADLVLRDGRVIEQTARVLDIPGEAPGRAWFFRDVTHRRSAEEALHGAKSRAETANEAKSAFLAMVSHELRTPLSGILGMVRLLSDSRLTMTQRAWVEACSHSGEVMLAVLDDLMDYNRLETAGLELVRQPFDLVDTARAVVRLFEHRAADKGLRLTMTIAPDVPPRVIGDANRLRQILMNLVGNAVKFTQAGSVIVRVDMAGPPACGVRLHFAVEDTGIGMSAGTLDRAFEPFFQGDPAITRTYGGAGLGLAICRRLVELQDGEIGAESRLAEGSRFWFTLPYALPEELAQDAAAADEPVPALPARPLRALVADDNAVNQRLVTTILEARGHRVAVVEDGAQAVAAARLGGYDLLILDLRMPTLGGVEAARMIRSLPGAEGRVPIIALTAGSGPAEAAACRAAGIDTVVTKPFTVERLMAAMAVALAAAEPPRRAVS